MRRLKLSASSSALNRNCTSLSPSSSTVDADEEINRSGFSSTGLGGEIRIAELGEAGRKYGIT
jgi:hypothetical protein